MFFGSQRGKPCGRRKGLQTNTSKYHQFCSNYSTCISFKGFKSSKLQDIAEALAEAMLFHIKEWITIISYIVIRTCQLDRLLHELI